MGDNKGIKKYNYLYKTTNLVNNKIYIGIHSTDNLEDGYIGCGIRSQAYVKASNKYGHKSAFHDAVLKYGYNNFKKEILYYADSKNDILELEELIVDREFIQDKSNYNISIGGSGGATVYKTSLETDNNIFKEYMLGSTKEEICNKYNVSKSLIWRIIKDKDRNNRKVNDKYSINKIKLVEEWLNINGCEILNKYINWNITWVEIGNVTPFDLKTFNFLEKIEKNKKYICDHSGGNIYFDTQKEISEIIGTTLFISGILNVVKGKTDNYKGYKFKRNIKSDKTDIDFKSIIKKFIENKITELNNRKYNSNIGATKKLSYAK